MSFADIFVTEEYFDGVEEEYAESKFTFFVRGQWLFEESNVDSIRRGSSRSLRLSHIFFFVRSLSNFISSLVQYPVKTICAKIEILF